MNQDLVTMLLPLAGTILGYVGRMFTKEQMLEARLMKLERDMDAAHQKLREKEGQGAHS